MLHGCIPCNVFNIKKGLCPQKTPTPNSQVAQDVPEQTNLFPRCYQERRATLDQIQSIIWSKTNASKLKERVFVYVLQPRADHQRSKLPFIDFRWTGLCIIEETLPNSKYLVCKISTNKTQMPYRMSSCKFTCRQPIPDVQSTPREKKPSPDLNIHHDDLFSRAQEHESKKLIFDSNKNRPNKPNSAHNWLQSDLATDEMSTVAGTQGKRALNFFPRQKVHVTERIVFWSLMQIRVWNSLTLLLPATTAESMINVIIQSRIALTVADIEFLLLSTTALGTLLYTFWKP